MARPSKDPVDIDNLPKGMMAFTVKQSTLIDSQDNYRGIGDTAALNKKDAAHYLKLGVIEAELPDFGDEDDEDDADKQGNLGLSEPVKQPPRRART